MVESATRSIPATVSRTTRRSMVALVRLAVALGEALGVAILIAMTGLVASRTLGRPDSLGLRTTSWLSPA